MTNLQPGASKAVHVCMNVQKGDRVVIVSDHAREAIGRALEIECESAGATSKVLLIEDFMVRPARELPAEMRDKITSFEPTVSFYAAQALPGELVFRRPYMDLVIYQLKLRHGHMVGITEPLMEQGMNADYKEISRITHRVTEAVKGALAMEVTAPSGTDIRATFDPAKRRWHPCPGLYHKQGEWGNLPEGETFTSPMSVEGVIGAEVLGDHFSEKYGVLSKPAKFELSGGSVRSVDAEDEGLKKELEAYLAQHENSNRVGEYAIGTNVALKGLSGNLLQDEKVPGVHIAFGYPYPKETGADWTCPSHLDVVATRSTIKVDGQYLMKDGTFVI